MMRPGKCAPPWLLLFAACSSDDAATKDQGGAATAKEWTTLVDGSWTLPPGGEEPELCIHKVVEEDIYVSAIRPVHPFGTHHTLLTASDGMAGCNSSLASSGLLYAAGVGSEGFELPEGVAMKIEAGKTLNLGLHLYNVSTEEISGRSAIEIVRVDPEDVEVEAEAMLVGPFDLSIPPGRHTVSDECTLPEDQTIFAIFPHMHQMGVHFKATFVASGTPSVVHDEEYAFEEQYQILVGPTPLAAGDKIQTECTWENPTGNTVGFGESSDTEMCFNIVFQYPARGRAFCGASGGGSGTIEGPPCAMEGDPGNDVGVGKHCTEGGGECGGGANLCLADYVDGDFGNFCTALCDTDADCGEGATCVGSGERAVCFPTRCAETLGGGAGADGGADAG